MLRVLAVALALMPLTGCIGALEDATNTTNAAGLADAGPTVVAVQRLAGVLTSAAVAERELVPDQAAGQAHREIYVADGTSRLTLTLQTTDGELHVVAGPRGCEPCPVEGATEGGQWEAAVDAPQPGPWVVELRAAAPQAPDVTYALESEHARDAPLDAAAPEAYDGSVVAIHTGAVRVSPDQLGEVLREVWVPEGTALLRVDVEAAPDLDVVVGKWAPQRDRESERSFPTEDGRVVIEVEAPEPGGWYVIFFHPAEGPGVQETDYTMMVTKSSSE